MYYIYGISVPSLLIESTDSTILYPHERVPTKEHWLTPHFGLNFLLRSNVYSNMRPCVTALEEGSSNGWFMMTELQIIEVRLISNLTNGHRTN